MFKTHVRVIVPASDLGRFQEMLQRWGAIGNTVYDLTDPRFEPQTFRSRHERVTARPTGRFNVIIILYYYCYYNYYHFVKV